MPEPAESFDINTAAGMLKYLLRKNDHGVWFVRADDTHLAVLPHWMWGHCEKAMADAKQLDSGTANRV